MQYFPHPRAEALPDGHADRACLLALNQQLLELLKKKTFLMQTGEGRMSQGVSCLVRNIQHPPPSS